MSSPDLKVSAALGRRRLLEAAGALTFAPMGRAAASTPPGSRLVLLGTAGGPTPKANRAAPAQAIIVGDAVYVIDCGDGVARQMVLAGLPLSAIRGVFITHLHSDHTAGFGNLLLLGWASSLVSPVDCFGPPTLARLTALFLEMNAADIQNRMAEEGRRPLGDLIRVHEITGGGPVMSDARITVTAALVDHGSMRPAFGDRFDCPDRSIVMSGDTRPSARLAALAAGADVLVHEVMLPSAIETVAASEPGAATLRRHLLEAHSTAEEVGRLAAAAGVKTLVLSHFVPGGLPAVPDEVWAAAVRPYFSGRVVIGHDLLEL